MLTILEEREAIKTGQDAIQKLVTIICGCVFEIDRRLSPPDTILWHDFKKCVEVLRECQFKIDAKFL